MIPPLGEGGTQQRDQLYFGTLLGSVKGTCIYMVTSRERALCSAKHCPMPSASGAYGGQQRRATSE